VSALRKKRVDARLSVADLADRSGISRQTIASLESGRTEDPQTDTLVKLADALGCQPSEIDPVLTGFPMPSAEQAA
jgi:transcriptional regulator with XRE-family HTH domain